MHPHPYDTSKPSRRGTVLAVILGLALGVGLLVVARATAASQLQHRLDRIHRQYVRDHGTVRFMVNHPFARHHRRFMRIEKQAERRIVLEHRERRTVLALIHAAYVADLIAPWLPTVACENGGRWYDSPGYFMYGLQFDPVTWRNAASHTGRWDASPESQVVNAIWTARHAKKDPWPNCPDPYFG